MLKKIALQAPSLNLAFKKRVRLLAAEGSILAKASRDLSDRMLQFAKLVRVLSDQAFKLDDGDNGPHHRHLREVLAKAVGTEKDAVVSKWITIGSQVHALLPYSCRDLVRLRHFAALGFRRFEIAQGRAIGLCESWW
jgi:hypothetical protein